ncbi:MAG: hypothetical protein J7M12_00200 [Candidatus Hydrogenedentes bacterium]|nr:hypothetical protein [Candidatus Hydrogenedentota bacterium]
MKTGRTIFWLFVFAAVYDGGLGLVFLLFPTAVFRFFDVTLPNHLGYVQFPAALLIVFSIMFVAIALRPVENRNLIPYGILLKASYCGVVFAYWIVDNIPFMWKPFAILDLVWGILFYLAYRELSPSKAEEV